MAWRKSGNKYGAEKCRVDDHIFDSRGEANFYSELLLRQKAGEIKKIERQITVPLYVYGKKWRSLRIDFLVTYKDGSQEWIEYKGFLEYNQKAKYDLFAIILEHEKSEIGFRMVFSNGQEKIYYMP